MKDCTITEYRLLENGEVEAIFRDASIDDDGVYHLLGKLQVSDEQLLDNIRFHKEDMGTVISSVPFVLKDGSICKVPLKELLILSDNDDTASVMKKFADHLAANTDKACKTLMALLESISDKNTGCTVANENECEDVHKEDLTSDIWTDPLSFDREIDATDYLINYNERFKDALPTMFREEVIMQTIGCIIGKMKPNALLIGAAGVGKTRIVEDIARRITCNDPSIPGQLRGYTIWELPLSNIVAGSGLVGDVEKKVNAVLEFAQDPENKCILFIDEVHFLASENQSYDKIAQILKPALARGSMKVIAATTLQESQNLMKDPAFNRRFTRLIVDEFSKEQTEEILKRMKEPMFEHYHGAVSLDDKVIHEIVQTADEFKTAGSHRPDNALTLMDRAMAEAFIERESPDRATVLSRAQLRRTAMRIITGNNEKTEPDMKRLREKLSVIKGQDEAVRTVMDIIERDSLNLFPRLKPLTFLFAGNSGVGKTEIARILASELTDAGPIILNMTEYHSDASINRIIGSPVGYKGCDSKAELPFDILESNPYQVILLDEFEKADRSVQRLFMNAFEEGWIKTAGGKLIDFTRALIIVTTNAGHKNISEKIGFYSGGENSMKVSIDRLSDSFDPELLNRFTAIIEFNTISKELFADIMAAQYERDVADIRARRAGTAMLPQRLGHEQLEKLVRENYTKEFGARPVKKVIRKYIEDMVLAFARETAG